MDKKTDKLFKIMISIMTASCVAVAAAVVAGNAKYIQYLNNATK